MNAPAHSSDSAANRQARHLEREARERQLAQARQRTERMRDIVREFGPVRLPAALLRAGRRATRALARFVTRLRDAAGELRALALAPWQEFYRSAAHERTFVRKAGGLEQRIDLRENAAGHWQGYASERGLPRGVQRALVREAAPTRDLNGYIEQRQRTLERVRDRRTGVSVIRDEPDARYVYLRVRGVERPVRVERARLDELRARLLERTLAAEREERRTRSQALAW